MPTHYPIYYEDAAHIVRVLTDCGLPLSYAPPIHVQLGWVASMLGMFAGGCKSQADAGASIVDILHKHALDDARRRRLNAIAGTLVGNFLVTCRRPTRQEVRNWASVESRKRFSGFGRVNK